MKKDKEYIIAFKGLKDGKHQFNYVIDKDFFLLFDEPLYTDGDINVDIEMNKGMQMLVFDFDIKGTILSVCDVCLEPVNVPVNCQSKLYVKFGEQYDEPAEDVTVIPHQECEFDLKHILYDLIVTSLPIRHIHEVDKNGKSGCNPEMLKKLEEYKIEEPNVDQDSIDPRWEELKKLIDKN